MSLPNPSNLIEYEGTKFLIFDSPSDINCHLYLKECEKYNVGALVRVCESTYNPQPFIESGIVFYDLEFPDGTNPPDDILLKWRELVKTTKNMDKVIAVHCVAGLGRAPVLVCTSLIDFGMDPLEAVDFVRKERRHAINVQQLKYLRNYKYSKEKCVIL
jgi:protein tyrosine phosphatase type 4A